MIYDEKYNIPIFEDEDILDAVDYSEKLKNALVTKFDKDNNTINTINNNIDGISDMVISINRSKADANSVYTKKESDNKYANAIKEKITKVKEAQINSTGANLQNVQLFGESTQETREGYNCFNTKKNVGTSTNTQVTILDNNNIKVTTTQEENWKSTSFLLDNLESNTNYFLKANIENSNSLITNNYCVISNYTTGTQIKSGYDLKTGITFNTGNLEDRQSIQIAFSATNATAAINTATFSDILLVKNVDKEKKYEDFGAMPSIDNPSPITSITGTINYKTTGKNIFDGEMELGSINWATGEFEDNTNCIRSKNYTEVIPGKYYAFSNSRNYTHNVYCYDKNKQFISAEAVANNTSYQIPANIKYIRFRTTQGNVENNLDTDFQIEKGSAVTDFEAYKEKTTAITLPEGAELCSLPNGVVDCVDSTGVIHKKILKIALGTQNWSIYQSEANADRYYCFTSDVDSLIKEYPTQNTYNFCNIAQSVEMLLTSTAVDKDSFCIGYQGTARLRFMLKKDVIDAQEGDTLRAKLNNLFISKNAYILAENIEETTQNLAETEKAKMQNLETFEGINNITTNAPLSAIYNTDTKSYIDSKFNTLAQQLLNIVGGN